MSQYRKKYQIASRIATTPTIAIDSVSIEQYSSFHFGSRHRRHGHRFTYFDSSCCIKLPPKDAPTPTHPILARLHFSGSQANSKMEILALAAGRRSKLTVVAARIGKPEANRKQYQLCIRPTTNRVQSIFFPIVVSQLMRSIRRMQIHSSSNSGNICC